MVCTLVTPHPLFRSGLDAEGASWGSAVSPRLEVPASSSPRVWPGELILGLCGHREAGLKGTPPCFPSALPAGAHSPLLPLPPQRTLGLGATHLSRRDRVPSVRDVSLCSVGTPGYEGRHWKESSQSICSHLPQRGPRHKKLSPGAASRLGGAVGWCTSRLGQTGVKTQTAFPLALIVSRPSQRRPLGSGDERGWVELGCNSNYSVGVGLGDSSHSDALAPHF